MTMQKYAVAGVAVSQASSHSMPCSLSRQKSLGFKLLEVFDRLLEIVHQNCFEK